MEYILTINPGSTSTKVALFEEKNKIFAENLKHTTEELAAFEWLSEQVEYRKGQIDAWMQRMGFDKKKLTLIMSRGGFIPPAPHGAILVNQPLMEYLLAIKQGEHASNIGCAIADCFAKEQGISAYI